MIDQSFHSNISTLFLKGFFNVPAENISLFKKIFNLHTASNRQEITERGISFSRKEDPCLPAYQVLKEITPPLSAEIHEKQYAAQTSESVKLVPSPY